MPVRVPLKWYNKDGIRTLSFMHHNVLLQLHLHCSTFAKKNHGVAFRMGCMRCFMGCGYVWVEWQPMQKTFRFFLLVSRYTLEESAIEETNIFENINNLHSQLRKARISENGRCIRNFSCWKYTSLVSFCYYVESLHLLRGCEENHILKNSIYFW